MAANNRYNNMDNQAGVLVIPFETDVNYAIQRTMLPAVRLLPIDTPYQNGIAAFSGETPTYDRLVVDFLADENNEVRDRLHEWMRETMMSNTPMKTWRDLTLHLYTKNSTLHKTYIFVGAHVTDIEQLSFDTSVVEPDVQVCSATFAYQYYYRVWDNATGSNP